MDTFKVLKAMGSLEAFKENLPTGNIEEKYVNEYHRILGLLQQETGHELQDFVIPDVELKQRSRGAKRKLGGGLDIRYTNERFCDRAFFLMKLDATFNFFGYLTRDDGGKRQIGF